jgi:hypothetical protein
MHSTFWKVDCSEFHYECCSSIRSATPLFAKVPDVLIWQDESLSIAKTSCDTILASSNGGVRLAISVI